MNTESLNMLKGVIEPGGAISLPTNNPLPPTPSISGSNFLWYFFVGFILLVILFVYLNERNKPEDLHQIE